MRSTKEDPKWACGRGVRQACGSGEMGRCEEAEGAQRGLEIKKPFFALEKYSLLGANIRYCSENFVPAPAFLLHNKNKNENKNK